MHVLKKCRLDCWIYLANYSRETATHGSALILVNDILENADGRNKYPDVYVKDPGWRVK